MQGINSIKQKDFMKRIYFILIIIAAVSFNSCIKNDPVIWEGSVVELDAAIWNANAAGLPFPILTRVPAANRALSTACPDSTLRRYPQTIRIRVNLVGAQSGKDISVSYEIFNSPITTVAFPATIAANAGAGCPTAQTPAAAAATLAVSDAVAGTHFTALSGTTVIPANSSFGYIDIPILNPGPTAGAARFIGIRLKDNENVKVSVNYREAGFVIDQR
jgi:hypothetical protein